MKHSWECGWHAFHIPLTGVPLPVVVVDAKVVGNLCDLTKTEVAVVALAKDSSATLRKSTVGGNYTNSKLVVA